MPTINRGGSAGDRWYLEAPASDAAQQVSNMTIELLDSLLIMFPAEHRYVMLRLDNLVGPEVYPRREIENGMPGIKQDLPRRVILWWSLEELDDSTLQYHPRLFDWAMRSSL